MKYYLDTEFNGYKGELISLALLRDDDVALYLVCPVPEEIPDLDPWVAENVIPILYDTPDPMITQIAPVEEWGRIISRFLRRDPEPHIICDWPADAAYFAELLMYGPGMAVTMSDKTQITILRHLNVYPTVVEGAIQHNAYWDVVAIRAAVNGCN